MVDRLIQELQEVNHSLVEVNTSLKEEKKDRRKQIRNTRLIGIICVAVLGVLFFLRESDRRNEEIASCRRGNESRESQNELVDALRANNEIHEFLLNAFSERVPPEDEDRPIIDELFIRLEASKEATESAVRELRNC